MPTPMQLRDGDRDNFYTLLKAASDGHLALVSAIRKSDGASIALICAMGREEDTFYPTPLAVMIEGDPYELYEDPTET